MAAATPATFAIPLAGVVMTSLAHLSRNAVRSPVVDCWRRLFRSARNLSAITALVSAYGLFFSPSVITNNLSLLNDIVPDNVLSIVHEQTSRTQLTAAAPSRSPSFLAFWSSLWSAMSGVKGND